MKAKMKIGDKVRISCRCWSGGVEGTTDIICTVRKVGYKYFTCRYIHGTSIIAEYRRKLDDFIEVVK